MTTQSPFGKRRLRVNLYDSLREKCSHTVMYAALFPVNYRTNLPRNRRLLSIQVLVNFMDEKRAW